MYISEAYVGKGHDYALLKSEFPPEYPWFKHKKVRLDSGYQGFQKDYVCAEINMPHKKTKAKELTPEQKELNRLGARERIKVEHSIGGLKRYRILSDRARIRDWQLFNRMIGVCAGLWNFSKFYVTD